MCQVVYHRTQFAAARSRDLKFYGLAAAPEGVALSIAVMLEDCAQCRIDWLTFARSNCRRAFPAPSAE
jgi:hypothetical protein